MKRNLIRILLVMVMIFSWGCAGSLKGQGSDQENDWKSNIKTTMGKSSGEGYKELKKAVRTSLALVVESIQNGDAYRVTFDGVYLVPKDDTNAPSFEAAKVRLASDYKNEVSKGKNPWLEIVAVENNSFSYVVPNFARRLNVSAFVEGFWGIGQSVDGRPGFMMIDPNDPYTTFETVLFRGYKTKDGQNVDLNTLMTGFVMFPDGSHEPTLTALKRCGIKKTKLKAGIHSELAKK